MKKKRKSIRKSLKRLNKNNPILFTIVIMATFPIWAIPFAVYFVAWLVFSFFSEIKDEALNPPSEIKCN